MTVDATAHLTKTVLAPLAPSSSEDNCTPYQSEAADLFNDEKGVLETTVDDLLGQGGLAPSPHIRLQPGVRFILYQATFT
ncbi:hypothetical protein D9619_009215 [Psilocybe cf. subviscida]|uniref:Uncharacterized protein n=1 Tax=Psilocybe cf. subviscida TaxID=2480587 RepID=A0A8H5BVN5_9AGAR|nr:hypothetical protein D9619_009215 [Psilocybe cf. subviscida]